MDSKANKSARTAITNAKGQKNLEGKAAKPEDIEEQIEIPEAEDWVSFLQSSKSNANSVISPSKFPEGNYEFVSKGVTEVDYKDGLGEIEVSFLKLRDLDSGRVSMLKVTPTLVDVIEELPFDILRCKFHYFAKAKSEYKVIINITILEDES
jgi:hypothetical protein